MNLVQVSWDDVNRTERAGPHFVSRLRIDVFVSQRAIDNWRTDPVGCHNVVEITIGFGKIYCLGFFEPCQKD
jgi:hypothetical protein